MIPCLNPVTTGGKPTFEEFLDAAAACDFGGVEFSAEPLAKLVLEQGEKAARDLMAKKAVKLAVFGLPVDFRSSQENFTKTLPLLEKHAKAAQVVGCTRCCTWLNPAIDDEPAQFAIRVTRRLRECAKILGEHGITLGLEWVGPLTMRVKPDGTRVKKYDFIYTLPQTLELIDAINEPNVGLVVDSFHWFTAHHTVDDLQKLPREKIIHVHVNDAPDKPIEEQEDKVRLLPGEGVIDLKGFLNTIKACGYHGFFGIETFSETVPKLGLQGAAKAAKQALEKVMKNL